MPKEAAVRAQDPPIHQLASGWRSHAGDVGPRTGSLLRQEQLVSSYLGQFLLHGLLNVVTEGQLGVGNGAVVPSPFLESKAGISIPQSQLRQLGTRDPAGHHPNMHWASPLPADALSEISWILFPLSHFSL